MSDGVIGFGGVAVADDCFDDDRDMEKGFFSTREGEIGGRRDELDDDVFASDALEAEASNIGVEEVEFSEDDVLRPKSTAEAGVEAES